MVDSRLCKLFVRPVLVIMLFLCTFHHMLYISTGVSIFNFTKKIYILFEPVKQIKKNRKCDAVTAVKHDLMTTVLCLTDDFVPVILSPC